MVDVYITLQDKWRTYDTWTFIYSCPIQVLESGMIKIGQKDMFLAKLAENLLRKLWFTFNLS